MFGPMLGPWEGGGGGGFRARGRGEKQVRIIGMDWLWNSRMMISRRTLILSRPH
jgi:hypothetical protein